MRIVCPNCGAQYEVDAALIPAPGRDVQCSNCGRGWFQAHGVAAEPAEDPEASAEAAEAPSEEHRDEAAAAAAPDAFDDAPEPEDEPEPEPASEPEPEPEPAGYEAEIARMVRADAEQAHAPGPVAAASAEPEPEPEAEQETAVEQRAEYAPEDEPGPQDDDEDENEPEPAPAARPLVDVADARPVQARHDPDTLNVLREEAQRELTARQREREGLEMQPDLGLEAAVRGRPAQSPALSTGEVAARKDLLPDIDEIKSSLSPETTVAIANSLSGHAEDELLDRRRGFRLGFGTMVLAAALAILLYLTAPWLARAFPGAEVFLISYVDWANGVRDWIDGLLAAGVDRMS